MSGLFRRNSVEPGQDMVHDQATMLAELAGEALAEWLTACNLFNEVTEPHLIDYLIFWMEAAEKKYIYLLNEAKQENVAGLVGLR